MFSIDEKIILIEFLDRVTIKGHSEREEMNKLVAKLLPASVTNKNSIVMREEVQNVTSS